MWGDRKERGGDEVQRKWHPKVREDWVRGWLPWKPGQSPCREGLTPLEGHLHGGLEGGTIKLPAGWRAEVSLETLKCPRGA